MKNIAIGFYFADVVKKCFMLIFKIFISSSHIFLILNWNDEEKGYSVIDY